MSNTAELERHVRGLAAHGNVELVVSATRRPRAFRSSPSRGRRARVVVPPVRGQVTYFVALHELGHVLSRGNASLRQLEREADAWRFALRHSLVEPTPATARSALRSLESYLLRAQARARRGDRIRAAIPGPDSVYWQVRAELADRAGGPKGQSGRGAANRAKPEVALSGCRQRAAIVQTGEAGLDTAGRPRPPITHVNGPPSRRAASATR